MGVKVKKSNGKRGKELRRRRIIHAVIAVLMVLAMVIAIFEALFYSNAISTPPPAASAESGR